MTTDEQFIRRAIRLAMNGRGKVEPNPLVGCVLVRDGRVIGEGYHAHFGGPHAEPTALASCTESPEGATAYVTLEPCCHTNKKTPPCAPRLIRDKIARVVVGCLDPSPFVNGKGVRMLRDAGIQIDGPELEAECKQLIAPFLLTLNHSRPYVTLKWAESADGKVAGPGGERRQISNAVSSREIHILRGRSDAIGVGIGTVLSDNPALTVRGVTPDRTPTRLILDSRLRVPESANLVRSISVRPKLETYVFCAESAGPKSKRLRLEASGVVVIDTPTNSAGRLQLAPLLRTAQRIFGPHLLIEAGPTLGRAFLSYGLADRVWIVRSPRLIADNRAPIAPELPNSFIATGRIDFDSDRLTEYLNTHSEGFFAPVPSADFVLAESSRSPADRPAYADPPA